MKVYLLRAPEYEVEAFNDVCDFLISYNGPIEFVRTSYEFDKKDFYFLQYELFPFHNFKYPSNDTAIKFDPERIFPLSWRELFALCDFYRELFSIEDSSFVVLLTKRKNSLNWFSAYDNSRNIFVHTAEWEQYTKVSARYPISYQVVENVLQSLMQIDKTTDSGVYVHEVHKGCMNDFCYNKQQIIIKLQTANICQSCIEKIKNEEIGSDVLKQVKTIFSGIRNEFIFQAEEHPEEPTPLIIDEKGRVLLPDFDLEIRLTPLFKTLYLFLLTKPEGVSVVQLSDFKDDMVRIYKKLKPSVTTSKAKLSIDNLTHPLGDGFNPTKTHINKIITNLLNDPLADFYRISGEKGEPYYVKIPKALVDIRF